jgi:oligoendopeptidase F
MTRSEIQNDDKWNVEALYPDFISWQKDYEAMARQDKSPRWPELTHLRGHLGDNPSQVKTFLDESNEIVRKLTKLYTYAHLRHDEDITDNTAKSSLGLITALLHDFSHETAWFEPELLASPESTLQNYLDSPLLLNYKFLIEKIVRVKKHTLSPDQEQLLALSSKALQAPQKAFSALNDADLKYGSVIDSKGNEREITHGTYQLYLRDQDRTLRERAFKKFATVYADYENTLCELISGQVQAHLFNARARGYSSCLEAALFPKNIDTEVYHALIKAVHNKMSTLHKYLDVRKRALGLKELHLYDVYVPLTPNFDLKIPYTEAEDLVVQSVAPLGKEYQDILRKGFKEQRWVDRYENKNKRSGAYSSGCFDSMPYILMNYKTILRDVFTLAHEAGHSMHSYLSHQHQPFHYSDYPIFLAEVASTFNEELLMRLLLERAKTKEEKIFLINQKVEDIRATLFRQTMFAEFELAIHEAAENNTPITPQLLKEMYHKLNVHYFGDGVVVDPEIDSEWSRIPHFYYNFYVFQYATGISAAMALAEKVVNGSEKDRDAYLSFLKGGCSRYPIDLLQMAGVDMRKPEPVMTAITKFGDWTDQLEKLLF